jgi:hypothetical protein
MLKTDTVLGPGPEVDLPPLPARRELHHQGMIRRSFSSAAVSSICPAAHAPSSTRPKAAAGSPCVSTNSTTTIARIGPLRSVVASHPVTGTPVVLRIETAVTRQVTDARLYAADGTVHFDWFDYEPLED